MANQVDFSTMAVDEEREIEPGSWESVRPVYERCQAYTRSQEPAPQFEFQQIKQTVEGRLPRWLVRRIR